MMLNKSSEIRSLDHLILRLSRNWLSAWLEKNKIDHDPRGENLLGLYSQRYHEPMINIGKVNQFFSAILAAYSQYSTTCFHF